MFDPAAGVIARMQAEKSGETKRTRSAAKSLAIAPEALAPEGSPLRARQDAAAGRTSKGSAQKSADKIARLQRDAKIRRLCAPAASPAVLEKSKSDPSLHQRIANVEGVRRATRFEMGITPQSAATVAKSIGADSDLCPSCGGAGSMVGVTGNEITCSPCAGLGVVEPVDPNDIDAVIEAAKSEKKIRKAVEVLKKAAAAGEITMLAKGEGARLTGKAGKAVGKLTPAERSRAIKLAAA